MGGQPSPDARGASVDPPDRGEDLASASLGGGAATLIGQGAAFGIQLVATIVLARLLTPNDFGLIAMVTAVTGFALLLKDLGLSTATIQKSDLGHGQVSTLFWINVGAGLGLCLLTIALSPAIAWFYSEPRLVMITVVISAGFVLGGLTAQHKALLTRHLRLGQLATIQVISTCFGVAGAIAGAIAGWGYWSLVLMQILSALFLMVGVWMACRWRPGLPMLDAGVGSMLVFGGNVTGFNVTNYFARNADKILIGGVWGEGPLGLYSKAYTLMMLPLTQINIPLAQVAIAALSKCREDPERYASYYLKAISVITLVTTPFVSFCIVCSEPLVRVILGAQWIEASRLFAVLGFAGLIQPLYYTQGWLHNSMGRSDRFLRWGLVGSATFVVAFCLGIPYGAFGVALAYAVTTWVILVPCMWYAAASAGIKVGRILWAAGRNVVAGLLSIACVQLTLAKLEILENWEMLLAGFALVAFSYFVFVSVIHGGLAPWRQLCSLGTRMLQGNTKGR